LNRVVKEAVKSRKRASITAHRYLPPKEVQVAAARAWGVPVDRLPGVGDMSPLYVDDWRKIKRTTNWPGKVSFEATLINAALSTNVGCVFVANIGGANVKENMMAKRTEYLVEPPPKKWSAPMIR